MYLIWGGYNLSANAKKKILTNFWSMCFAAEKQREHPWCNFFFFFSGAVQDSQFARIVIKSTYSSNIIVEKKEE
jgi:hypothetical protein